MFFGLSIDLPGHREIGIRENRAILCRQVADMAIAGDDLVVVAQILVDGLRLRRRFDDDDFHESRLRAAFVAADLAQGNEIAGMTFHPSGKFQLEEEGGHCRG